MAAGIIIHVWMMDKLLMLRAPVLAEKNIRSGVEQSGSRTIRLRAYRKQRKGG
ncbi:MAG: hypothetical protein GY832_06090 [Chloroflexi bacterium]|nr:hypothetical protein [Chloroflexota bacterium]